MSIQDILAANPIHRLDEPAPDSEEIAEVERLLGVSFPPSYREFLALGGLNDLRFAHQFLRPTDIPASQAELPDRLHIPFADNGCGDLLCWPIGGAEPQVVFWDHEARTYSPEAGSFTAWLAACRF
jgi:hypothetical protein